MYAFKDAYRGGRKLFRKTNIFCRPHRSQRCQTSILHEASYTLTFASIVHLAILNRAYLHVTVVSKMGISLSKLSPLPWT